MSNPQGYARYMLGMDAETTGLYYCKSGEFDPSYNPNDNTYYQALSWGFIVVDIEKMSIVEELYIPIKWDGNSRWSTKAEEIHGISKKSSLDEGLSYEDAASEFYGMFLEYWAPTSTVVTLGHNQTMFDLWFLRRWLTPLEIMPKISGRNIDTSAFGLGLYGTYNSNDLFKRVGLSSRKEHNALQDIKYTFEVVRRTKLMFDTYVLN